MISVVFVNQKRKALILLIFFFFYKNLQRSVQAVLLGLLMNVCNRWRFNAITFSRNCCGRRPSNQIRRLTFQLHDHDSSQHKMLKCKASDFDQKVADMRMQQMWETR